MTYTLPLLRNNHYLSEQSQTGLDNLRMANNEGRVIDFATQSSIAFKTAENVPPLKYIFPPNKTISSRYTLINFFPKSLLEQFRRLANVYFLVIGIIAAVGEYSSYYETAVVPWGILGPMGLVVLISVIKDGIVSGFIALFGID
jgi:hypothetical protein